MTNNQCGDKLKPYLIRERTRLILLGAKSGLNFSDIARIFKVDKSAITRTISANIEDFKSLMVFGELPSMEKGKGK